MSERVSIVFPWRAGCPHRERSFSWVQTRMAERYPDWEQVHGASGDGPFSRTQAILDGASKSSGDVLVIMDTDVDLRGDMRIAVERTATTGWAIPHKLLHRLSAGGSDAYMAGADLDGLEMAPPDENDNHHDCRPYRGYPAGTLLAIRADVLAEVPPDPRFVGWGQEEQAWSRALGLLIGKPWRGGDDLVHLWHPHAERINRRMGSVQNVELLDRYEAVRRNKPGMRALLDETRVPA